MAGQLRVLVVSDTGEFDRTALHTLRHPPNIIHEALTSKRTITPARTKQT